MEHKPVLLNEVLKTFENLDNWIVDCTLGRGGHFFALLKNHNSLIGIDRDLDSINFVKSQLIKEGFKETKEGLYIKNRKKVLLSHSNFANLFKILNGFGISNFSVGGILADLGISTYQIKESGRGLSFLRLQEPLDMRLDKKLKFTASDLLSFLSKKELENLFKNLGEVRFAKTVASRIVNYRRTHRIKTVLDFLNAAGVPIKKPSHLRIHPATKLFMALRIAVNQEHLNLKKFLKSSLNYVYAGAVLDVITFHSLEEKAVLKFIKKNNLKFEFYLPTSEEINKNKSARSAKLYVIKKNETNKKI